MAISSGFGMRAVLSSRTGDGVAELGQAVRKLPCPVMALLARTVPQAIDHGM
jgi:hypothetical protein